MPVIFHCFSSNILISFSFSGNHDTDNDTCDKYGIASLVKRRDELDAKVVQLYKQSELIFKEEESALKQMKEDESKMQDEEKELLQKKSEILASLIKIEVFITLLL